MMVSEKWVIIQLRELHSEQGDHWSGITQLGNSPAGMLSTYLSMNPRPALVITRSSALLQMLSALQPSLGMPWVSV